MAYWGERRGRTRVEQEMKKLADIQLNTNEGFFVQPIGYSFFSVALSFITSSLILYKASLSHVTNNVSGRLGKEC